MSKPHLMVKGRVLPAKEAGLFRELLTLYEARQLKKGLKTAEQILKKFPEHGGQCANASSCLIIELIAIQKHYA
jgi:hypothetical protein